jgi:outer membrane biogenesis lipoprotein LolB
MKPLFLATAVAGTLFLNACSLPDSHLPKFKHDADTFVQQQKELLKAEKFTLSTSTSSFKGQRVSYLSIQVVNAQALPNPADSSAAAVKRLAHRVVAELSNPNEYQAVQVAIKQQKGLPGIATTTQEQSFSYSVPALQ